jgi:hypothetical protein
LSAQRRAREVSYAELYLDFLSQRNPEKLRWLRSFGTLYVVLAAIDESAEARECELIARLAPAAGLRRAVRRARSAVTRELADLASAPAP